MIKHLVIGGGGTLTLRTLGSLQHLLNNKIIQMENIKTIHGTSAGAIIGVCISLNMEIDLIINYFVNRPWEDIYDITPTDLYNLYSNKGIFNKQSLIKLLEPLMEYNQLSLDITLEEFYKYTNIDIHMFTLELNNLEIIDLSYSSFPNLSLIDAIYMTSSLPFAFEPFLYNDTFYVDAGIIVNYPLSNCINFLMEKGELTQDRLDIMGFNTQHEESIKTTTENIINGNMISYTLFMIKKLLKKSNQVIKPEDIPNTITYKTQENTFSSLIESISSKEKREQYVKEGNELASSFTLVQNSVDELS
jgi:predicted acylesterase/phospholipase RssA